MAITWPITTLPFHSVMFARRNLSRSGGLSLSGIEQVVQSSSDFWEAQATLRIHRMPERLAYRALQAQNWGRAGEWVIPVCDPFYVSGGIPPADFSFDSSFDSSFALGSMAPPVIPSGVGGSIDVAALKGARTLDFEMIEHDLTPLPGQYFSIGDRLYLIGTVTNLAAHHYRITFAPGLRAAAPIDTAMEFSNPRCLMRLAQDNVGQMSLDLLRFADVQLSFVEVPV